MNFNNSGLVKGFYIVASVTFCIILILMWTWPLLGIPLHIFRMMIVGILCLIFAALYLIRPTYFSLKITDKIIQIRYYHLIAFSLKPPHKTIEILISEFRSAEVETSNYGLSQRLIIYVSDHGRLLSYPSLSISLFKKADLAEMLKTLQTLSKT